MACASTSRIPKSGLRRSGRTTTWLLFQMVGTDKVVVCIQQKLISCRRLSESFQALPGHAQERESQFNHRAPQAACMSFHVIDRASLVAYSSSLAHFADPATRKDEARGHPAHHQEGQECSCSFRHGIPRGPQHELSPHARFDERIQRSLSQEEGGW